MNHQLTARKHSRITSVSRQEWNLLYPSLPDSFDMIAAIEKTGFPGFKLESIVVYMEGRPVVHFPTFETIYNVEDSLDGAAKALVTVIGKLLPSVFHCKTLGVGFVAADVGQIGFDRSLSPSTLRAAWDTGYEALNEYVRDNKISILTFVDLDEVGGGILPANDLNNFQFIPGQPYCILPITFSTLEEYLSRLSKATRKDLKRKLKLRDRLSIVRATSLSQLLPYLSKMYDFYISTLSRSDLVFGAHTKEFFADICRSVPDAEFVLYFSDNELIGFNLLEHLSGKLVDRLFCMDSVKGRSLNLYFISWIVNIEYCIDNGVPLYHAGAAREDLKLSLGATIVPTELAFRHMNSVINWLFSKLLRFVRLGPKVEIGRAELGTAYLNSVPYSEERSKIKMAS